MDFRIADTFTDSLARLTGDEQKAIKTSAFDLQMNPANPGFSYHKLDHARDKNFWSVRVNTDIRLIVHRTATSLLLCYVDHHDKAYAWAACRKLETHPATGAAQFVEIRERVEEIPIRKYVKEREARSPQTIALPLLFATRTDQELLAHGVPQEWLSDVRVANEDTLLDIAGHLPAEAAEALLDLATGGFRKAPMPMPRYYDVASCEAPSILDAEESDWAFLGVHDKPEPDPFEHPDAQRRFRTIQNVEELERAFAYPWDKWTVFLHPAQRELVERNYTGPGRVSGSAGTGKTIVALHRAAWLARAHPDARILLTTFSENLANALRTKIKRLLSSEPRLGERIDIHALDAIAVRLYEQAHGPTRIATPEQLRDLLADIQRDQSAAMSFAPAFVASEWQDVVDAWQLHTWQDYRDVRRLGRRTRLPESQRAVLWALFEQVRQRLDGVGLLTMPELYLRVTLDMERRSHPPFDFVVVDEAQDLGIGQLRFLVALGEARPDALFFAGDLGQRIFQQPFSWKSLGVDVRGRSRTLQVNYRTSHQIRTQADRLLSPEMSDVDGNVESRRSTVSVFNGPQPDVRSFKTTGEESNAIGAWLGGQLNAGLKPSEIAIFVRADAQIERARHAVRISGAPIRVLDGRIDTGEEAIAVGLMHMAKGLEFRAVAVMACDDEVIPSIERIEGAGDESELRDIFETERHLLYVAFTRAREFLTVTGVDPVSEFLGDMRASSRP